jgi:DNA polymerase III alpha subunit
VAVHLGLRYAHGLGEAWPRRIVKRRGDRPFQNLRDFCQHTRLSQLGVTKKDL